MLPFCPTVPPPRPDLSVFSQAIRDWLHEIHPEATFAANRTGYAPYTKNKLKQLSRTGAPLPQGLVDRLDPDALVRAKAEDEGARLEAEDAVRDATRIQVAGAPTYLDSPPNSPTSAPSCAACTSTSAGVNSTSRSSLAVNPTSPGGLLRCRGASSGQIPYLRRTMTSSKRMMLWPDLALWNDPSRAMRIGNCGRPCAASWQARYVGTRIPHSEPPLLTLDPNPPAIPRQVRARVVRCSLWRRRLRFAGLLRLGRRRLGARQLAFRVPRRSRSRGFPRRTFLAARLGRTPQCEGEPRPRGCADRTRGGNRPATARGTRRGVRQAGAER